MTISVKYIWDILPWIFPWFFEGKKREQDRRKEQRLLRAARTVVLAYEQGFQHFDIAMQGLKEALQKYDESETE